MTPEDQTALRDKVERRMKRFKEILEAKDWEALASEFGISKECIDPEGLGEAGHGYKKLEDVLSPLLGIDLNGDGKPDLGGGKQHSPAASVMVNEGDGNFAEPIDFQTGAPPTAIIAADLDGDSDEDLVVANGGSPTVSILKNSGGAQLVQSTTLQTGGLPSDLAIADLDGDGRLDLVVATKQTNRAVVFWRPGADDVIVVANPTALPVPANPAAVVVSDLDQDGKSDLALACAGGQLGNGGGGGIVVSLGSIVVLRNLGGTQFAQAQAVQSISTPVDLASGDLNADGLPDLVAASPQEDAAVLFYNLGGLRFDTGIPHATPGASSVVLFDLDLDGDLDLAAADSVTPGVSIFSNLIHRPRTPCEAPREIFKRGDADGSGELDISDPIAALSWLFTGGREPVCLDAADSNDDGVVDISDPIGVLGFLFLGASPPDPPGPSSCGPDPTGDELPACDYAGC